MTDKMTEIKKWYETNKGRYESCGSYAKALIESLLDSAVVSYHSIDCRIKTEASYLEKCERKQYANPTSEITDFCGLRIICYTNQDVSAVRNIIEKEFDIDAANSEDKRSKMKDDQVGYLSVHYIALFNKARCNLPEYSAYKGLKFEIQIRTLLQHAWAEIEHDRNYKFSAELPKEIKRRFYLVAGALELLDREFEHLSSDIDHYEQRISKLTQMGKLDVEINTASLTQYLASKLQSCSEIEHTMNGCDKNLISELNYYGILTLQDLDNEIQKVNINMLDTKRNYPGFLRAVMMLNDTDKYFSKAWNNHWQILDKDEYDLLVSLGADLAKYHGCFEVEYN